MTDPHPDIENDRTASEPDMDEECEAKGCDIRPGDLECRRCGAEADTEDEN